jgi:hypothetical protein
MPTHGIKPETTAFAEGDRVKVKDDHWTGLGAQTGVVEQSDKFKTFVMFDNGTLVEIDTRALESDCRHESKTTADGHGAFCRFCGETLA